MINLRHQLVAFGFMFLAVHPEPVNAGFFKTGNDLLESCEASKAVCAQYVIGSVDSYLASESTAASADAPPKKSFLCMPSQVDSFQLVDIVVKYLKDRPSERHWPGAILVTNAVLSAFPCSR